MPKNNEINLDKVNPAEIKNLVFQGGSVKGIAYVGALEALVEHVPLEQIKRVAGTSAGAITACLLAIGLDVIRIKELLEDFDFKKILDDKPGYFNTQSKILKTVDKVQHSKPTSITKIPAKTVKIPIISRLATQFGIYEGDFLREWIDDVIGEQVAKILGNSKKQAHLTLGELNELTKTHPKYFKTFGAVGVNLNEGQSIIFRSDDPTQSNIILSDVVRLSMSIPFLFKPHHVFSKIDGERKIQRRRDLFIDGGFFDNYPINIFDNSENSKENVIHETLGFCLVNHDQKSYLLDEGDAPTEELKNFITFSLALVKGSMKKQDSDHAKSAKDKFRTIYIDHCNISTLKFNLDDADKHKLIESGQEATNTYLQEALELSRNNHAETVNCS